VEAGLAGEDSPSVNAWDLESDRSTGRRVFFNPGRGGANGLGATHELLNGMNVRAKERKRSLARFMEKELALTKEFKVEWVRESAE